MGILISVYFANTYPLILLPLMKALVALKKGSQLIKYSRKGKPKLRPFRISTVSNFLYSRDIGFISYQCVYHAASAAHLDIPDMCSCILVVLHTYFGLSNCLDHLSMSASPWKIITYLHRLNDFNFHIINRMKLL